MRANSETWRDELNRAQELIYEAWEAENAAAARALAEKALTISPVCGDAYVLLAQGKKPGSAAAVELWRLGLAAARAGLARDFEGYVGEFWEYLETRPYMRALFGLAHALWLKGERVEAADHLLAMLRLNPNDNQGARYILAPWLVTLGEDEVLEELLSSYPEDGMATWAWTAALAAFRKAGDTEASRELLMEAIAANPHVPAFLCGGKRLPAKSPPFYGTGDVNEARVYLEEGKAGWEATPGALDWLRAQAPLAKPVRGKAPPAKKPE